jgi:hypothetical protein
MSEPTPEQRRLTFKNVFIRHHRKERERSESCIGDIIDILGDRDNTDAQTIQAIIDRIISHYDR